MRYRHAEDAADGLGIFGAVPLGRAIRAANNKAAGGGQNRFDLALANRESTTDEQPGRHDQLDPVVAEADVLDRAALAIRKRYLVAAADRAPFVRPLGVACLSSHRSSLLELLPANAGCPATIERQQQDRVFS